MRLSAGRCYEIAGTAVRRLMDGPPEGVTVPRWKERQADLMAESSTIIHLHHRLTPEELGLWSAMQRELAAIDMALATLPPATSA